jgi:hypothetical protein
MVSRAGGHPTGRQRDGASRLVMGMTPLSTLHIGFRHSVGRAMDYYMCYFPRFLILTIGPGEAMKECRRGDVLPHYDVRIIAGNGTDGCLVTPMY